MSIDELKVDLEEFIELVIQCLKESQIQYVIVGGIASIIWGRPRSTTDVDIVIGTSQNKINIFSQILKKNRFNYGIEDILTSISEKSLATVLHKDYPYKIDIQGAYEPINKRALENRLNMRIFKQEAFIEAPEDLIIAKIIYGSSQDYDDIKAILIRQKTKLNMDYLRITAKQESILKDLEVILSKVEKNNIKK